MFEHKDSAFDLRTRYNIWIEFEEESPRFSLLVRQMNYFLEFINIEQTSGAVKLSFEINDFALSNVVEFDVKIFKLADVWENDIVKEFFDWVIN